MLKTIQAWQHPTLRLLYSKRLDGARLLSIIMLPNCSLALIVRASDHISSAVKLILAIEIQNMNGCVGHNKQHRSIYSNRTVSWIDLPTALIEYIDLVLQNKAGT